MAVRFSADAQEYTRTLSLGAQTQWTVCCWAKITTDRNAFSTVWSLDAGNSDFYMLQTNTDGVTLGLFSEVSPGEPIEGAARVLTVGTWYFIGVTVNGTNGTMISRALGDTAFTTVSWTSVSDPAPAPSTTITNLRIGDDAFGGDWLNGCVAAFKLWTGATLTADEMANEAWSYQPRRTTNLRAWYPLTRAETTDYTGNGFTLSGGTGATTEDGPGISWRGGRRRIRPALGQDADAAPAVLIAPWSVPTPAASAGASVAPSPVIAPWSVPTPDVTTAGSPPTIAAPPPVIAAWSVPAPVIQVGVTVHAAPVIATWAIPTPAATVPVNPGDDLTGPGQISYDGFRLGDGTAYLWRRLSGAYIDMPPIDNGNVNNPSSDGAQSGRKLSQPRVVVYDMRVQVGKDNVDEIGEQLLTGLPLPDADEELPFAYRVGDLILVGNAAVVDRKLAIDRALNDGFVDGQVIWELSDPRFYSQDLANATIVDGGTVEVTNAGNRKTRPLIRVPGPANTPHLEVFRTLADGSEDLRVLEFNTVVAAGQVLTIDVARGTAELADGTSLTRYLGGSVALTSWVLGRGVSEISYETADGNAPPVVALWRHAWL